jgi:hypothetical protein
MFVSPADVIHSHSISPNQGLSAIRVSRRRPDVAVYCAFSASVHESFGGVWYRWLSKHDFVEDS